MSGPEFEFSAEWLKSQPVSENNKILPEIVVYEHINFGGSSIRTNLSYLYVGDEWNDRISSFVVVRGVWEFYEHRDFGGNRSRTFGPGYYSWVEDYGIPNDWVSSFKCVGLG